MSPLELHQWRFARPMARGHQPRGLFADGLASRVVSSRLCPPGAPTSGWNQPQASKLANKL